MHPVPLASLPTNESSLFLQSITEVINPDSVFYEYDRLAHVLEEYENIQFSINITNYYVTTAQILDEQPTLTVICHYLKDKQCAEDALTLYRQLSTLTTQREIIRSLDSKSKPNDRRKRDTVDDREFTKELVFLFDQHYREVRVNLEMLETRILRLEHNIRLFKEKQKVTDLLWAINYLSMKATECYFKGLAIHKALTGNRREMVELISEKTLLNILEKIIKAQIDETSSSDETHKIVPLKAQVHDLLYLLENENTEVELNSNILYVKIKVPIVRDQLYRSTEAVSVPFTIKNETGVIRPQFRFGLVERDLNATPIKAYPLNEEERRSCEILPSKILLCKPTHELKSFNHVGELEELFAPGCNVAKLSIQNTSNYVFCSWEKRPHVNTVVRIPQLNTDTYYIYIVLPMHVKTHCGAKQYQQWVKNTSKLTLKEKCWINMEPKPLKEERANYTMIFESEIAIPHFHLPDANNSYNHIIMPEENITLTTFKLTHNFTETLEDVSNNAVQLFDPYRIKVDTNKDNDELKTIIIACFVIIAIMLLIGIIIMSFFLIRESNRGRRN